MSKRHRPKSQAAEEATRTDRVIIVDEEASDEAPTILQRIDGARAPAPPAQEEPHRSAARGERTACQRPGRVSPAGEPPAQEEPHHSTARGERTACQRPGRVSPAGPREATVPSPSTLEHEISGHHAPAGQRLPNPRFRELPRLTRLEALWSGPSLARWRALLLDVARDAAGAFGRALEAPVSIEDLGTAAGASPIAGFSFTAGLGAGLGICEARLCPSLVAGLLEALTRSAAAPIAGRPDPVTAAVLGHGALLACNALRDAAIARPRLVSSAALRSGSPNVSLEVALRIGEHAGHLQLRLDEISARALARALDENTAPAEAESHGRGATSGAGSLAPSATREEGEAEPAKDVRVGAMSQLLTAAGHLPSRAQVVMGPVRLSARSVASLRPGDVVCPDPAARFVEGKVRGPALLVSSRGPGARCAIGTLDGLTFSITALGHPTPTAQEPEMPTQGPSHDTLPIDVHVVLETLPMTLAELARVGEGTVVQLSSPPSRVRLRAADHTVAVGELVDIEGVLGVRVIEGGSR